MEPAELRLLPAQPVSQPVTLGRSLNSSEFQLHGLHADPAHITHAEHHVTSTVSFPETQTEHGNSPPHHWALPKSSVDFHTPSHHCRNPRRQEVPLGEGKHVIFSPAGVHMG